MNCRRSCGPGPPREQVIDELVEAGRGRPGPGPRPRPERKAGQGGAGVGAGRRTRGRRRRGGAGPIWNRPQARLARSEAASGQAVARPGRGRAYRGTGRPGGGGRGRRANVAGYPTGRRSRSTPTCGAARARVRTRSTSDLARRRDADRLRSPGNATSPTRRRFMPATGGGFVVGYNAQLAVTADHLILAVNVVQDPYDDRPAHADVRPARLGPWTPCVRPPPTQHLAVGTALLDAGYASRRQLPRRPGPDRTHRAGQRTQDRRRRARPPAHPVKTRPPRQKMAWRTDHTGRSQALYKKRGATVEPVNSHLKDQRGLRRLSRRGITAAKAELLLAALTTNLLRLFTTHHSALREAR